MSKIFGVYRKIGAVEKIIFFLGLTALVAVISWRIQADTALVTSVAAGILVSGHIVLTYPKSLFISIITLLHIAVIPFVAGGYAVLSPSATAADIFNNIVVMSLATLTIFLLTLRIRSSYKWLVLTTSFLALDILGILLAAYFLPQLGIIVGIALSLVVIVLWAVNWKIIFYNKKSIQPSSLSIPVWKESHWESSSIPRSWQIENLSQNYYPLQKAVRLPNESLALVTGIHPGAGLRIAKGSLYYNRGSLDSMYEKILESVKKFSLDKKVNIYDIDIILLSSHALPNKEASLDLEVESNDKNNKIYGVLRLVYLDELDKVVFSSSALSAKKWKSILSNETVNL